MNRIPLDQEELISKERKSAEKKSKKEIKTAMEEIDKLKAKILKDGEKDNLGMKDKAEGRIDNASHDNIRIIGVNCTGNATGGIDASLSGSGNKIQFNSGSALSVNT